MRRKLQYIILSVLLIVSMTGCAFTKASPRYGLITDSSGVGKTGPNADIMNTLLQIAKQNESEARAYEAATDRASDLNAQLVRPGCQRRSRTGIYLRRPRGGGADQVAE